jgi:hypothetical protein
VDKSQGRTVCGRGVAADFRLLRASRATFRLHVENTGFSTIKDCCGYIIRLTKRTSKGQIVPHQEVLDLGWAHKNTNPRDIPRGAFFHMDVATLHLLPAERKVRLPLHPTTLDDFFNERATYELEILVAADNARPCRRVLVMFDFDPQTADAAMKQARIAWGWAQRFHQLVKCFLLCRMRACGRAKQRRLIR